MQKDGICMKKFAPRVCTPALEIKEYRSKICRETAECRALKDSENYQLLQSAVGKDTKIQQQGYNFMLFCSKSSFIQFYVILIDSIEVYM